MQHLHRVLPSLCCPACAAQFLQGSAENVYRLATVLVFQVLLEKVFLKKNLCLATVAD